MERREFLKLGATACTAAWTGSACLGVPEDDALEPVGVLARKLYASLTDTTEAAACVAYDHPLRQYHNRGVSLGGAKVGLDAFSWDQLELVNRLFYAGLSAAGRGIVPRQQFLQMLGVRTLRLLFVGDPNAAHYQVVFSGPHMNLRLGGKSREGVAFGGPIVYGDQHGNNRQGLPGNVYRYQFQQGQELYSSLSASQRRAALLDRAPIQTQIELQGEGGSFPGVPVKALSTENHEQVEKLIESILRVYRPEDVAYAEKCLEANGGVDALYLSYYRDGEVDASGEYQIFRLEGPAAVFYFRGFPHVHAFINVAMDGNRPLSVGEALGENPAVLEGEAVKALFERAMKETCATDFAYYDRASVVGRLRAGLIRTGDVYNLESWVNGIHVATMRGRDVSGTAAEELAAGGLDLESEKTYTIATTDYVAEETLSKALGRAKTRAAGVLLRDATIDYLKRRGGFATPRESSG